MSGNFQTDFEQVSRIGATAVELKAKSKNSAEQEQQLKPLLTPWSISDLRTIAIAIGTTVEQSFRPQ